MTEKEMSYSEAIEATARAATHAKKEWTAFEGVLDVLKMAQAAKTEAELYKATQMKHSQLKTDYAGLDAEHKTKSTTQETERAQKKATMDGDLRSYALKLEGDLKKAKADHDVEMAGMKAEKETMQATMDAMEREKKKFTESLASLRAEAKAHADKAVAAATGGA